MKDDQYEEIAHWERIRTKQIALIADLEAALGDLSKEAQYIEEYGEEEGRRRYRKWRRATIKRRTAEVQALSESKTTIRLIVQARDEVQLLVKVFRTLTKYPELADLQREIWNLMAKRYEIYLSREESP